MQSTNPPELDCVGCERQSQLAAMLAHDMRGLLVAAQQNAAFLLGHNYWDEESVAATRDIHHACSRMAGYVADMLDVARGDGTLGLQPEAIDLEGLLSDLRAGFFRSFEGKGLVLRVHRSRSSPAWYADPRLLLRVVGNLLDNAGKFSPARHSVLLSAQPCVEGLLITVSDYGPGIPEDARARIFDPYAQARPAKDGFRGWGLGLAFCRLAVEAHGGAIWYETRPAGGTDFHTLWPYGSDLTDAERVAYSKPRPAPLLAAALTPCD